MLKTQYLDDKLRACPSFERWSSAVASFIRDNLVTPARRAEMNDLSVTIAEEFRRRDYIPGPKGVLP